MALPSVSKANIGLVSISWVTSNTRGGNPGVIVTHVTNQGNIADLSIYIGCTWQKIIQTGGNWYLPIFELYRTNKIEPEVWILASLMKWYIAFVWFVRTFLSISSDFLLVISDIHFVISVMPSLFRINLKLCLITIIKENYRRMILSLNLLYWSQFIIKA